MSSIADTGAGRRPAPGRRAQRLATAGVLALVFCVGFVWSLSLGPENIGLGAIIHGTFAPNHSVSQLIVHLIRLPRALLAGLAGAALAVAGVVMQAITRNPLGAPEVLGVNAGAAVTVALVSTIVPSLAGVSIVFLSFAGAAAAAALVFGIASFGRGNVSPVRLALAGVTISIVLFQVMQGILIVFSQDAGSFFFWLVGGVSNANWHDINLAYPWILGGFALAFVLAPRLNILALGDDVARGLGQNVGRTRVLGAVDVVLLAGAAIGVAGPIAFLGLIVPHIARKLVGHNHLILIPVSMLGGATILIYADIVTRYLDVHVETPAGLITAIIGAPFLVYLARREKVAG